jgi:hypothetical protein
MVRFRIENLNTGVPVEINHSSVFIAYEYHVPSPDRQFLQFPQLHNNSQAPMSESPASLFQPCNKAAPA